MCLDAVNRVSGQVWLPCSCVGSAELARLLLEPQLNGPTTVQTHRACYGVPDSHVRALSWKCDLCRVPAMNLTSAAAASTAMVSAASRCCDRCGVSDATLDRVQPPLARLTARDTPYKVPLTRLFMPGMGKGISAGP